MIVHQVEAVVLRTWPIHEADQIVSLFTRDYGKIKGVAKSAARSRRRFGGALEPMTHVRAHYAEKPSQELVRLDSFDILHSPLAEPVDYARAAALALFRRGTGADAPRSRSPRCSVPTAAFGAGADPRRSHLDADYLLCSLDNSSHGLAPGFEPLSAMRRIARRPVCLFSFFLGWSRLQ